MRFGFIILIGIAVSLFQSEASAQVAPAAPAVALEKATFSGGNFWYLEPAFRAVDGVVYAVSGYTGGANKKPTYTLVTGGHSGHFEAVQVSYDPSKVTYETLLETFWHNVDPLDGEGQFCDRGETYFASIVVHNPKQLAAAQKSKEAMNVKFGREVTPIIRTAMEFYPAEDYLQAFYYKYPEQYTNYKANCGRDARLQELWPQAHPAKSS
jgi:peptide-methionine (S)-S-oxide reductase